MSGFSDYDQFDGLGLAELVAKREVSAEELLEEAISRTEKVNGEINAVVHKHYDEAKSAIANGLPEGPFTGVPFLLKDLHLLLTGTITTYGSAFFKDNQADHDSTLVSRYKKAGLVIFGKTNTPEFGAVPVTEPRLFGATRNPWDLTRTPGGSSGGGSGYNIGGSGGSQPWTNSQTSPKRAGAGGGGGGALQSGSGQTGTAG